MYVFAGHEKIQFHANANHRLPVNRKNEKKLQSNNWVDAEQLLFLAACLPLLFWCCLLLNAQRAHKIVLRFSRNPKLPLFCSFLQNKLHTMCAFAKCSCNFIRRQMRYIFNPFCFALHWKEKIWKRDMKIIHWGVKCPLTQFLSSENIPWRRYQPSMLEFYNTVFRSCWSVTAGRAHEKMCQCRRFHAVNVIMLTPWWLHRIDLLISSRKRRNIPIFHILLLPFFSLAVSQQFW